MKKLLIITFLLFFSCNVFAFTDHSTPDGFLTFIEVESETTIKIWMGNFRYPTELMVMTLSEDYILNLQTFTYLNNQFSNFQGQFVGFGRFVNTGGFFVEYTRKHLKIQNNYTGSIYELEWLADWFFTMAVWRFTYWDVFNNSSYTFTDTDGRTYFDTQTL